MSDPEPETPRRPAGESARAPDTTTPFIVAEVSKTWIRGCAQSPLRLGEQFELVINVNHRRGYQLHSFQVSQVLGDEQMVETIIAVFERLTARQRQIARMEELAYRDAFAKGEA